MARTATARAGKAKGPAKAKKTPKPPPPIKTPKRPKKPGRKPTVDAKTPDTQAAFLATVKADNPGITSEELAIKFAIPFEEVCRLRHFVHEYIKDFNEENAALRMGYPDGSAKSTGKLLLFHSFTQLRVSEILAKMEVDAMLSGSVIIAGLLREANAPDVAFSSNASTRIAAWKALAKIKGLERPKLEDPNNRILTGGIMIVPIAVSADQWGEYAAASQANLKQSTAIDI